MRGIYGIEYKGAVIYVGQSADLQRRFAQHRSTLRRSSHRNFILQRIYDKHPEALSFTVLEESEAADLAAVEQQWMDSLRPATNLAAASGAHPHSEAAKAKMRAYVRTPGHRAALSAARKGRSPSTKGTTGLWHHTPEARAKITEASRGRKMTPDERRRRSEAQRGRAFSEDHKEKLRQAKLGKSNEAVRRAMTGRRQSPEVIAKRMGSFNATIAKRRDAENGAK